MSDQRKYRELFASSAVISIVSLILSCVSFFSPHWINAEGIQVNLMTMNLDFSINYGLFKGKLIRTEQRTNTDIYNIHFTCVWKNNSCAWSCLDDQDARLAEVEALIGGKKPEFSCRSLLTFKNSVSFLSYFPPHNYSIQGLLLNAGMHLSVVLLIILTIICLFICVVLGVLNYAKYVRMPIFNLTGIIISSIAAFCFNLAGLVVYRYYYEYWIKNNIGILDVIVHEFQTISHLGFGYWLLMAACFLNPMSILMLYIRYILLKKMNRIKPIVVIA